MSYLYSQPRVNVRAIKLRRDKIESYDQYAYPNSWIYQIGPSGTERVSLEEAEHYMVAKRFLNDPHQQLARLLD
jgi:hypothetical protein